MIQHRRSFLAHFIDTPRTPSPTAPGCPRSKPHFRPMRLLRRAAVRPPVRTALAGPVARMCVFKRLGVVPADAGLARPFFSASKSDSSSSATQPLTTSDVARLVEDLHSGQLAPLNARLLGPLEKSAHELIRKPMVFVLGNHSSGKSTFVNYVCGRDIQTTGVAPTDDGFTIIVPGKEDTDQDGPALVGDPDMGFSGLRSFGGVLINHVNLKVRRGLQLGDVMVVDTPGMIDSPMTHAGLDSATQAHLQFLHHGGHGVSAESFAAGGATVVEERYAGVRTNASPRDRGYNFPAVVRWFAERADVVLLFFDPDKPGTTGETLAVMKTSLAGLEHKVCFILNKADQFTRVHDFARAYGSLCWNLSKVIPRKDLPMIYTMCVPTGNHGADADRIRADLAFSAATATAAANPSPSSSTTPSASTAPAKASSATGSATTSLRDALDDLDANRREIVASVRRAPSRRVDNLITRLYDHARLLRVHATVLEAIRKDLGGRQRKWLGTAAAVTGLLGAGAAATLMTGFWEVAAGLGALEALAMGGLYFASTKDQAARLQHYLDGDGAGLDDVFRREYFLALAEKDDFVVSLWMRVKPQLVRSLSTFGVAKLPRVKPGELATLDEIANVRVPTLRRAASKAASFIEDDVRTLGAGREDKTA